eukprot:2013162-Amphidinium_carterae.1
MCKWFLALTGSNGVCVMLWRQCEKIEGPPLRIAADFPFVSFSAGKVLADLGAEVLSAENFSMNSRTTGRSLRSMLHGFQEVKRKDGFQNKLISISEHVCGQFSFLQKIRAELVVRYS